MNFQELLNNYNVKIPIIQRDYAQGRNDDKAENIRNKFLDHIFEALKNNKELHLDFIYGSVTQTKKDGKDIKIFTPLDGQQRLTTLFLLHWYFGESEKILKNFSYETRASSREFCEKLAKHRELKKIKEETKEEKSISYHIKNQSWFMPFWEQDPTVCAMLNMLDSIENKAKEINKDEIDLDKLTFSLMIISDYGLDDDLYIKMNARGKSLNEFENFKVEFEKFLNEKFKNYSELDKFKEAIDTHWVDEFFEIYKNKQNKDFNIEKMFLAMFNYMNFLFEMLYYKNNKDKTSQKGKTAYNEITIEKKVLDCVIKEEDDLKFIDNAFKKISVILKAANDIFTEYWDGVSKYDEKKVYIFKDKNDNFNNEVEVTINKKKIKRNGILERLPYETAFNIEHKIYLYSLIELILKNKSTEEMVAILSQIRDYIYKSTNFYYLRRGRIYYERSNVYEKICEHIKKINDIIEKYEPQNQNLEIKKLKDHKYFQGNLTILDGLKNDYSQKIIDFFNQKNSIIISNLVYYGFNGWVLGSVYGGKDNENKWYAKRLFGGKELWHIMITRNKDFVGDNSLAIALKDIIQNGYKEKFSDDDYRKFKCNDWRYYFIKYADCLFEYDRNILAWYGGRVWDDLKNENEEKGDKPSLRITKLISDSGMRNEKNDKLIFKQILEKQGITNINLENIKLNENEDTIDKLIQNRQ